MRWLIVFILLCFAACVDKEALVPEGLVSPADHPLSGAFHTEASFPSMIYLTEKHHLRHNVQENKLLWSELEFGSDRELRLHLYNDGYSIGEADIGDGILDVHYELHQPLLATSPSTYRWPIPKITLDYFTSEYRLEIRLSNNYYDQYFKDIELISNSRRAYSLMEHNDIAHVSGEVDSLLFTLKFDRQLPLSEIKAFRIRWQNGNISPEYPLRNYFRDSNLINLQDYAVQDLPYFNRNAAPLIVALNETDFVMQLKGTDDYLVRYDMENPIQPSQVVSFPNAVLSFTNPEPHLLNRLEANTITPRLRIVNLNDLSSTTRAISSGLDLNQELYGPVNSDYFGISADTSYTYLRVYNQNLSLLKEHKPLEISTVNVVFTPEAHAFVNHPNRGADDGRLIHVNLQGHSLEIVHDIPHDLGRLWAVSENYLIYTSPGHTVNFSLVVLSRTDKSMLWSLPLNMPVSQATLVDESANLLVIHGAGFYRALRLSDGQVLMNDFGKNFGNSFSPPRLKLGADQKSIFFQNADGVGGIVRLP